MKSRVTVLAWILAGATPSSAAEPPRVTRTACLATARFDHASIVLRDGRVLVAGGARTVEPGVAPLASCEWIDAAAEVAMPAAPLRFARRGLSLALVPDGRVLAIGGRDAADALPVVELYDPMLDVWGTLPPLAEPRAAAAVVALPDGRVLVAGGASNTGDLGGAVSGAPQRVVEVYDPATNAWSFLPPLPFATARAAAVTLPEGRVLVAGGVDRVTGDGGAHALAPVRRIAFLDLASMRWKEGPPLPDGLAPPFTAELRADGTAELRALDVATGRDRMFALAADGEAWQSGKAGGIDGWSAGTPTLPLDATTLLAVGGPPDGPPSAAVQVIRLD